MTNINRFDKSAVEYFYSLPLYAQKQIDSCGLRFSCREDIERYYKNTICPQNRAEN